MWQTSSMNNIPLITKWCGLYSKQISLATKALVCRHNLPVRKWKSENYEKWLLITKPKETNEQGNIFAYESFEAPLTITKTSLNGKFSKP